LDGTEGKVIQGLGTVNSVQAVGPTDLSLDPVPLLANHLIFGKSLHYCALIVPFEWSCEKISLIGFCEG
jgi:hypothetical protein